YRRIVYWTLAVLAAFFYLLANEDLGYTWIFAASVAVIPLSFLYVAWGLRKLHRLLDGEGDGAAGAQLLRDWVRGRRGAVRATKTVRRVRVKIRRWRGTRALRRGLRTAARAAAPIGAWLRSRRDQLLRVPVHLRRWLGVSPENGAKTSPGSTDGKRLARWRSRRRRSLGFLLLLFGVYVVFALVHGVDVLRVFVAGSFFAVLIALDWYRAQFEGEHRRKVAYVFALSCLLLLSLLPSLGFLYLARSRQIQFFTQDAMVALAETVDARQERLESYQEPLEEEHYESYGGVLACTRDAYLDAFFSGRLQHPGEGTPRCLAPPKGPRFQQERSMRLWPYGWNPLAGDGRTVPEPQQRLRQLRRLLGRIAIQTLSARPVPLNELSPGHAGVDLSRFDTELTAWQRHRDSGGRDWLVFEAPDGPTSEPAMAFASEVPNVGSVAAVPALAFGLPVLGLVALGAGPFLFARFIARKLLLISLVYYGKRQPNASRREPSLQMGPLDPIEEVLDEARREAASQDGLVKRLVLVAGQLHREAWQDFVERGDYHEASFRRAWRHVAAETVPEESHGAERLPPRARSFGERLAEGAPPGRPILLVDFDPDSSDPMTAADQTAGLRHLMEQRGHAMVILTDIVPFGNPVPESDNRASEAAGYWTELLGAFPVRYARDTRLLDVLSSRESEGRKVLVKLVEGRDLPQAEHWHRIVRRIVDECEHTPTLRELGCHLLHEVSVEVELERVETAARALTEEIAQLEAVARAEARDVPEDQGAPRERSVDPARAETEAYEEATRREMASSLRRKQRHKLLLERRRERLETAKGYRSLVTEDHVIGRIGAEARLHYRYLWAQCSTDEKLVLVQLAENGL
ncbi:MAG TPA: hypothetical protein VMN39_01155, partial [Longimicrobiaceae bacterium]|nr:hypothetical protein [Longimicrobiaceae bacterium]